MPTQDARRRRNHRGEARRAALVATAIALISERGLGHVRVVDICKAAEVPNSTFYWYFRDLDDLVAQSIVDARRLIRTTIAAAVEHVDDPLAKIYVTTRESVRLAIANDVLKVMTVAEVEPAIDGVHGAELRKSFDVFIHDAVVLLSEGQVRGVVRDDAAALHLAHCLRSVVHYNVASYHRGLLPGDLEVLADTIASFAVRGICADPAQLAAIEGCPELARGNP
jgi:AcrR family transcriptional regulator